MGRKKIEGISESLLQDPNTRSRPKRGKKIERIPDSMLRGPYIHCRPKRKSPIVEGLVIGETKIVLCPIKIGDYCGFRSRMSYPSCLYPETTVIGPMVENPNEFLDGLVIRVGGEIISYMKIPEYLLRKSEFHCRPVEGGKVTATVEVARDDVGVVTLACPEIDPNGMCRLRRRDMGDKGGKDSRVFEYPCRITEPRVVLK